MLNKKLKVKFIRVYNSRYLRGKNELERSGWFGDACQWRSARRIILRGVHKSGTFLDVGCANGVLARDLRIWAKEDEGLDLLPYGIDIAEEFIAECGRTNPDFKKNFVVAEAMRFKTKKRFTFIRISPSRFYGTEEIMKKYTGLLEKDGRLIIACYYDDKLGFGLCGPVIPDIGLRCGYLVAGAAEIPRLTRVFWLKSIA